MMLKVLSFLLSRITIHSYHPSAAQRTGVVPGQPLHYTVLVEAMVAVVTPRPAHGLPRLERTQTDAALRLPLATAQ